MTSKDPQTIPLATLHGDLLCKLATGGDLVLLRQLTEALGEAREQGNVCVDLVAWVDERSEAEHGPRPDLATARERLCATGVVGDGHPGSPLLPLVLAENNLLYSARHYRAEQRIASFVHDRLQQDLATQPAELKKTLERLKLLPSRSSSGDETDWQLAAVVAGATRPLTVLCGGPGTGKTTTVAKLLSVLLHDDPTLRIAITAPTGKAAARLGEALQERAAALPELAEPLADLEPSTLHRLLGYLPLDDRFRRGRDKQLALDLVVIDEVSMVDPAIFAVLCDALPEHARLVLVGDKDQLAAVASGQVLGDLCQAARPELGLGAGLAESVREATGMTVKSQPSAAPIANATVALWKNHRFDAQPGIGAFAQALMQRRPDDAFAAFSSGHPDLTLTESAEAAMAAIEPHLLHLLAAAQGEDPEQALAAIPYARVLTAQRRGPNGSVTWNEKIQRRLLELGHRTDEPYYVGCPILITSNDQNNRIWNGDLGVCGRNEKGKPVVWIRDQQGKARAINPRRLPAHEAAWAMTVHKAQGSEFDHVLLSLPDRDGSLNHAALIYTGVTRARRQATVHADPKLLAAGLANWMQRRSGLAEALRAP
jgi:exodeoxyribonuclease V alpha subunit